MMIANTENLVGRSPVLTPHENMMTTGYGVLKLTPNHQEPAPPVCELFEGGLGI